MKKILLLLVLLALLFCFACDKALAFERPSSLQAIEVISGFGLAKLHNLGNYNVIPLFVDFDFDIKPLVKRIGINLPGLLEFVEEPFASFVYNPRKNAEAGNNFLIKIGILPEGWRFQPYIKGGLGFIYLTQHTREQGSQFNFNESAGLGLHYYFNKNTAFTAEYRFRHISNSGMRKPNHGINTNFILCGVMYSF